MNKSLSKIEMKVNLKKVNLYFQISDRKNVQRKDEIFLKPFSISYFCQQKYKIHQQIQLENGHEVCGAKKHRCSESLQCENKNEWFGEIP